MRTPGILLGHLDHALSYKALPDILPALQKMALKASLVFY